MIIILYILLASLIVSLISFIGILTLVFREKVLNKILLILVALAAGVLIGSSFLHLIPESLEKSENVFLLVILGFILFYLVEKILHWRHCHDGKCEIHSFAYINLFGDFFHNFLDGLIIAGSFLVDIKIGISATIAIAIHEIPQELGDFGILVYSGFKKTKALFINFIIALTAVLGGIVGYFLSSYVETFSSIIVPIAAGGFIYIAASDLIPELSKDKTAKSFFYIVIFIIGILLMYLLKFFVNV